MKYTKLSIKNFLKDLSAKTPVPGGGSASALVSSIGVSCLLMVVNYTLNKKGYERYQTVLKDLLSKFIKVRDKLLRCMEMDINLFAKVAKAYNLPKETQKQKMLRKKNIRKFLLKVNSVEEKIIKLSYETILLAKKIVVIGNRNLISDTGCGISFINSGAESALINLILNTKTLNLDRKKIYKYIKLVKNVNRISKNLLVKINKKIYENKF